MTVDAGDHGADRRQLDVVVGVNAGLGGRTKRVGAMRAGIERRFDDTVGGLGQRARHTRTTATALLLRRMIRTVRLLAARRRGAGIVRGLGRNVESGLKVGDLCGQHLDLRLLGQNQGNQVIRGESKKGFAIHNQGELYPP